MDTAEVWGVGVYQSEIARKELQRPMEVNSNMRAKNTENMTQALEEKHPK